MSGRRKLLKLATALLFSLLFLELLSRIGLSLPIVTSRIKGTDYAFRKLWVSQHFGLKKMRHVQDTYDPELGWLSIPNLKDMVVYQNKLLNTNSLGLRGPEPSIQKAEGKKRILVFGDSFTFGDEVSDNETYCHYLQQSLPQAEVINMGVHGYGHDQMLLLLKGVGLGYQPDIVILGYVDYDTYRNALSFRDFAKPKFDLVGDDLVLTNVPVPTPEQALSRERYRPAFIDLCILFHHTLKVRSGRYEEETRELTRAILGEFAESVRQSNAEPVFFYLPTPRELKGVAEQPPAGESHLFSLGSTLDPPVLHFSSFPGFKGATGRGIELKRSGHWDPIGNQIVADEVARFLVEEGLIDEASPD